MTDITLTQILHWLGIYLAIGLPALIILRVYTAIKTKVLPTGSMLREAMQGLQGKDSPLVKWTRVAGQLLMYPVVLLIWPVTVWIVIQEQCFSYEPDWRFDREPVFNCRLHDLVKVVLPDAAEAEAKVVDPLGRVPDLPFGHLNAGWRALLANRQPGDKLWYFHCTGYTPVSQTRSQSHQSTVPSGVKRGYALVHSNKVRAEFVFEWD